MIEATENLVLEMLRRMRATLDRMELDMTDIKTRTTSIEVALGQVITLLASQSGRMDRFDERLGRIERRLDLAEA